MALDRLEQSKTLRRMYYAALLAMVLVAVVRSLPALLQAVAALTTTH